MKQLITLLFGERTPGKIIQQPTFQSTYPANRPDESQWAQEVKFGARYGTRGSFYQNR